MAKCSYLDVNEALEWNKIQEVEKLALPEIFTKRVLGIGEIRVEILI